MKDRNPVSRVTAGWSVAALLLANLYAGSGAAVAANEYIGSTGVVNLTMTSCNAADLGQIPGSADFFIGRQKILANGQLPGVSGPKDCQSGAPSTWGLTLDQLDWQTHAITTRKVLLDVSLDSSRHSKAVVTGGPMRGLIIKSAYDADIVVFRGTYLVSYECIIDNGQKFGVDGTSSCVSAYDPAKQTIDLNRTQVVVSGVHANGKFYAAAVPQLLVFKDRLFVYWSALAVDGGGKFLNIAVRGTELEAVSGSLVNKKTRAPFVHSTDNAATSEVWAPQPGDSMSDTETDALPLWVHGNYIIAMSSRGGQGCAAPSDTTKGCFRLSMVRSTEPLGDLVFNHAEKLLEDQLPTNPQEYTHLIRDPSGGYWFIGHYIKPPTNGYSELRPVPSADFWKDKPVGYGQLVMFPVTDKSIWPTN
ncbi:MAG: hypothetical protein ACLPV8_16915 [Steroidobacteraceae bacterium]